MHTEGTFEPIRVIIVISALKLFENHFLSLVLASLTHNCAPRALEVIFSDKSIYQGNYSSGWKREYCGITWKLFNFETCNVVLVRVTADILTHVSKVHPSRGVALSSLELRFAALHINLSGNGYGIFLLHAPNTSTGAVCNTFGVEPSINLPHPTKSPSSSSYFWFTLVEINAGFILAPAVCLFS